jgi:hypothetical protein
MTRRTLGFFAGVATTAIAAWGIYSLISLVAGERHSQFMNWANGVVAVMVGLAVAYRIAWRSEPEA